MWGVFSLYLTFQQHKENVYQTKQEMILFVFNLRNDPWHVLPSRSIFSHRSSHNAWFTRVRTRTSAHELSGWRQWWCDCPSSSTSSSSSAFTSSSSASSSSISVINLHHAWWGWIIRSDSFFCPLAQRKAGPPWHVPHRHIITLSRQKKRGRSCPSHDYEYLSICLCLHLWVSSVIQE